MSEAELWWAAGFFDGEGSIGCYASKHKTPCVQVTISQKDREVLDRFAAAFGLGKVYGPYQRKPRSFDPHPGPTYYYQVRGWKAEVVAQQLRPLVGTVKRRQIAIALGEV